MEFKNKTAIITGASSGIGFLLSKCYAEHGGNVVMVGTTREKLERAVEEVNLIRRGSAIGVVCDVRDYTQVCHVRDEAVRVFSGIDLLVNLAGGAETRMCNALGMEFPDTPIEVYDWGVDVNLKGQLYFDHAVLKQMREQKSGLIIHIGSITGEEGCKNNVAYAASKSGAMYGMTKSIAQYGAQYGIRCCCISPGPVLTRAAMSKMKTMLGRAAETQEIVDMILYVASDKGQFLNGMNIMIDGGRSAMKHA